MKLEGKAALITGSARRLGAKTAETLHQNGADIIIHYRGSRNAAENLVDRLNARRAGSAVALQADLLQPGQIGRLAREAVSAFGRLDILVNNASTFYPTPIGSIDENHWDDLMGSNLKAPLFLSQACHQALKSAEGCIVNMVDIHARSPLKRYPLYSIAKAGKAMMTRALAQEMAPEVRVNGVAPGAILWPEDENQSEEERRKILERIPLGRTGVPQDVADAILFLVTSPYVNGQILTVDGGRQLF
jgi:pteridine reductase